MQGIGTQTDPFRPTNWSEFVTAIGTSGVYVSCPENAVWDMRYIYPSGLTTKIQWRARCTYGNGLTLRNLYLIDQGFFSITGEVDIENINFTNFTVMSNSALCMFRITVTERSTSIKGTTWFRGCQFSGNLYDSILFDTEYGSSSTYFYPDTYVTKNTSNTSKGCSMCINFTDSPRLGAYKYSYLAASNTYFEYCNIDLGGMGEGYVLKNGSTVNTNIWNKCYLGGGVLNKSTLFTGADNVFDVKTSSNVQILGAGRNNNNIKRSIVNSDKFLGGYGSYTDNLIKVTESQMSDVNYLQSQGFSIATENANTESVWKMGADGKPYHEFLQEPPLLGAFANATNLTYVRIPPTVKKIGRYSFRNTKLTSVTIASDCEYYDTSFPDGCQIKFY